MTESVATITPTPTSTPAETGEAEALVQPSAPHEAGNDELQAVYDVPVKVQAVLGRTNMEVSNLLSLQPGHSIELDRRAGEAVDIYVNNRLVARGELVVIDDQIGVTMTEIVKDVQR